MSVWVMEIFDVKVYKNVQLRREWRLALAGSSVRNSRASRASVSILYLHTWAPVAAEVYGSRLLT